MWNQLVVKISRNVEVTAYDPQLVAPSRACFAQQCRQYLKIMLLRYIDAGNILVDPVDQTADHQQVLHWFNLWCTMK